MKSIFASLTAAALTAALLLLFSDLPAPVEVRAASAPPLAVRPGSAGDIPRTAIPEVVVVMQLPERQVAGSAP